MKIGAFAELTGISAYTLRYYEKKGLLFVKRGQNGCRNYLAEDREWVQFLCKLKATGMLLRDIKRYAQLNSMRRWMSVMPKSRHWRKSWLKRRVITTA